MERDEMESRNGRLKREAETESKIIANYVNSQSYLIPP